MDEVPPNVSHISVNSRKVGLCSNATLGPRFGSGQGFVGRFNLRLRFS
jgi:hypothetical protein